MKFWYHSEGSNAGSSYTDFTSMNNEQASSYTDFTGFGSTYANPNSESFQNGYNDYCGFGSGYTDFTQPEQAATANYVAFSTTGAQAAVAGYGAAGFTTEYTPVFNRSVRQAPTFLKAAASHAKNKKGAGKLVFGALAFIAVSLGVIFGLNYFMSGSDNPVAKFFAGLGGMTNAAQTEIPLGQEGFAKYTTPTKNDSSSNGIGKGGKTDGANAAGAATGERRDVYEIADKLVAKLKRDNDVDTAWEIFNWVHSNVYYQTIGHSQTYEEAAYMGFTKKTGDCYVYFSCAKMLLDRAEIPNLMVKRYPVKKNAHFWNLVQLDGKWYHCDSTVYKDHPAMYFMCTDDEIGDKYHEFDKSLYPERAKTSNYYGEDEVIVPKDIYGDPVGVEGANGVAGGVVIDDPGNNGSSDYDYSGDNSDDYSGDQFSDPDAEYNEDYPDNY